MKTVLIFLCLLIIFKPSVSIFSQYGKIQEFTGPNDPGNPLFLTPLIEQGNLTLARNLSQTEFNGFKGVKSYSGYLTVNKQFNSNLFFWYFPTQSNDMDAPVILWLQGGPGASSLIGLFLENGPYVPQSKHGVKLRKYSWTANNNVIYIDSPVGTGYSFTNGGYAKNQTAVGKDLYNALLQFFQLFPELRKNDFFVTGESYGGKYVPAISYTIHKNNPGAKQKINLKGLSIGNGFCDPIHQLGYGDYLYQLGLVDGNGRQMLKDMEANAVKLIQNKKWTEAAKAFDDMIDGDLNGGNSLFKNLTGYKNYFNYLEPTDPSSRGAYMDHYVQRADIRAAIHVGNLTFHGIGKDVEVNLLEDIAQSVTPWISELLSNYRVLIYNGQLDIIVAYPLTINFLQNLDFDGAKEYKTAERKQWFVESELAGYVKKAGNLTEVLVRNAGHMVPMDQPKWAYDLITRFVHNKKFS